MSDRRLKKWELALICAVAVTLLWGRTPCYGWWGAVYPELSPVNGSVQTAADLAGGVVLRLRLLEWLEACLAALGLK